MLSGDTGVLEDKQREYVEKIHTGSRNLTELVQLFLDVSKIEMGALQIQRAPFQMETVVVSVLEELQPNIEKKMLRVEKKDTLKQEITTDAKLLRVVIQNLVSNAIKYTPVQGTIAITVEESGQRMIFTIRDSGCGIPTEQQHLIFSKMFRAHNAAKAAAHGFGLGLYMTKSIIESLGGTISFTSVLDQGTTFILSLPLLADSGQ
ncbi:MAG: multi-sensor signal transduction histidine kinase [Parcubacteria group bacterium Gr01-1014_48]|nr:MAG: multi-sensor signal transduction histidine kinase [Parcubacteria group bacterium Gr01-1014_48]